MDSGQQMSFSEGADVVGSDGNKVGEVVAVHQNYLVVEKGFFFPTDYYIPTSAVASSDGDKVYLTVTKDAALDQGWDQAPADDAGYLTTDTSESAGYAADPSMSPADAMTTTAGSGAMLAGAPADTGMADASYDTTTASTADTRRMEGEDTLRVPVHEEELTATTTAREIGEVRVEKDVVAEERVLDVPVTEERVSVQRRAVDRAAGAGEGAFEEGTIEVPLRGEEVRLETQVRVAEEIEIAKERVQRTEQVGGTVRREEVRVTEDSAEPMDATRTRDTQQ